MLSGTEDKDKNEDVNVDQTKLDMVKIDSTVSVENDAIIFAMIKVDDDKKES